MPDPVILIEYDPDWATDFELLRDRFLQVVGHLADAIEHVGSTSVPGLCAKPIIDIDLTASSDEDLAQILETLTSAGYENEGELGIAGRIALRAADDFIPHHLYLMRNDNREFLRHLAFRDHLRAHPETAQVYSRLKIEAAKQFHHDRPGYTHSKSEFIENLLVNCNS